ncbi:CPBP family archaeomyxosortase MrtA [Thermococcus peptonophilus]|uniref:CPBP family archaeomyxosortase MrtA n=1 Tax=Thermococcus peptonophilus TaxID=53952 RepID=UPI000A533F95
MREVLLFILLLPLSFVPWLIHTSFWEHVAIVSLFYLLIPAVVSRLMGFQWGGEVGISLPNKVGIKLFAVLFLASVPLSIYGKSIPPEMRSYYPVFPYSSVFDFILGELAMGITMLAHEAFYRGFLLFPLAKKNEWLAVILQNLPPYTIVHIGKPRIEVPYAFVAGIILQKWT